MLVCLQFESIGRRKRQNGRPGTRQVQCTSASHSLLDDVAAAHSDYERVTARTVAGLEDGVRLWFQPWKSST
jgi:antirestriction protein ArdC